MAETAVIAGVGRTIGTAVAREFHEAGMAVALLARSREYVEGLAEEFGDRALAVTADVTDAESVEAAMATVREAFGPVSVLVLNATGGAGRPVDQAGPARLREIFDVRVAGSLSCVRAALADLRATNGTAIFSGTTFADPPVPEQIEWGAVGPAASGLAASLDAALSAVQVTYVRIGSGVSADSKPPDGMIAAERVAETYLQLVEQTEATTRSLDLR
jgi:NADP-dependent 3-hydroxy acid dehydrogenase YdfG